MIDTHTAPKSPWHGTNLSNLLGQYTALENVFLAQDLAAQEFANSIRVPVCIANCGRCCEFNTPVITELEARYIVSCLTALPQAVRDTVFNNLQEWLTRSIPGVYSITKAPEARTLSQAELESLRPQGEAVQASRCAFLSAQKSCLIHLYRPISCRAWGITKPAAPYCLRPRGMQESTNAIAYLTGMTALKVKQAIDKLGNTGACGFLPTMIYRLSKPAEIQRLVEDGKVHEAKLTLGRVRPWLVFEDDGRQKPKIVL